MMIENPLAGVAAVGLGLLVLGVATAFARDLLTVHRCRTHGHAWVDKGDGVEQCQRCKVFRFGGREGQ